MGLGLALKVNGARQSESWTNRVLVTLAAKQNFKGTAEHILNCKTTITTNALPKAEPGHDKCAMTRDGISDGANSTGTLGKSNKILRDSPLIPA